MRVQLLLVTPASSGWSLTNQTQSKAQFSLQAIYLASELEGADISLQLLTDFMVDFPTQNLFRNRFLVMV